MEKTQKNENAFKLQHQLETIKPKYYALWNNVENMHSKLRVHFSTIVAAFLGIISSLHQSSSNICLEWWFFVCVVLSSLSLIFLLVSSFENLHNSIVLRDVIKESCDEAIYSNTPINSLTFVSPRRKIFSILFWIGLVTFGFAIIIFCIINIPIW